MMLVHAVDKNKTIPCKSFGLTAYFAHGMLKITFSRLPNKRKIQAVILSVFQSRYSCLAIIVFWVCIYGYAEPFHVQIYFFLHRSLFNLPHIPITMNKKRREK